MIKLRPIYLTCVLSFLVLCFCQTYGDTNVKNDAQKTKVLIKTNQGNITVELYADKAPKTVENFLNYVNSGFYKNTIFHRVIDGFMVQGGGFTVDFKQKPTQAPLEIESNNGLKNTRGTLAMARTSDPNSATAQFFINTIDNGFLDYKSSTPSGWGYAVFAKVTDGMDVVDKISKVKTGSFSGHRDVPLDPVIILDIEEVKPASPAK